MISWSSLLIAAWLAAGTAESATGPLDGGPAQHNAPVTAPLVVEASRIDDATALTLARVVAVAQEHNPTFAEFEANRDAARAEVVQAMAYPNPELELNVGRAELRDAPHDSAGEYGVGVALPIELPAKRRARLAAAEASQSIVEREEDVFRATLRAEVSRAYHAVLYYERALLLAKDALQTEREIEQIVGRRVEGGEAPDTDLIKAQVETLKASRTVQEQQRQLTSARVVLNALCGGALPSGFSLQDTLSQPLPDVDMEQSRQQAGLQHPTLRRLEAVLRQRELAIQRERKAWYPDLKPGVSFSREIDTNGFAASLNVELPLGYRNQGGIAAAQAALKHTRAEIERSRQEVLRDLETSVQAYESAREQLAAFQGGLRAAAAESLRLESFRYEEGEVDFLQLLDARRTARQTESEYLQALYNAQIAHAEVERAMGNEGERP